MLERDDNIVMAISGLTAIEESYFTIEKNDIETRTNSTNDRLTLVYSVSLDQVNVYRRVMTLSESLGNVGGLSGILFSMVSAMRFICFKDSA